MSPKEPSPFSLEGTIITSFIATIVGMLAGSIFVYHLLTQLRWIIGPQITGCKFDPISYTMVVLMACVVVNLIIVKAVFLRIPSVSISIMILSVVAKAQKFFDLHYVKPADYTIPVPNLSLYFYLFLIMAVMLLLAGITYRNCSKYSKTDVVKDKLDKLFKKYRALENIKESAIEIIQEIKEPELWGVFYKEQMRKVRCILGGYSNLLTNQVEQRQYEEDLEKLELELPVFRRMIVTGALAAMAVVCIGCMIFEIPL